MTVKAENVLGHEIIGLNVKVIESSDPTFKGISGTVVFETKNTILIRTGSKVKQLAKVAAKMIELQTESGAYFISGSTLIGRPEDRITRL